MPLPAYTNGTTSHRRTLSSSKSLAPGNPKTTLSSRVQSQSKLSALGKKRVTEVKFSGITGEDIFIDAAVGSDKGGIEVDIDMTFLQYCTACDKQILVPNSQALYCSESCRREDSLSTTPPTDLRLSFRSSNFSSSSSPSSLVSKMAQKINHSFDMSPTKEQTRLPLVMNATSLPAFGSKPAELHSYKPDLDPTEWKPNSTSEGKPKFPVSAIPLSFIIPNLLPEGALDIDNDNEDEDEEESRNSETTVQTEETTRPEMSQRQSAAFSYLSQFHRSASSFLSLSSSRRPVMNSSASASSVSIPTIPDRTSNPGTPGMSLGRSSGSSANSSSSSSSIPLSIPGRQSTISSIASHGVNHNAEEFGKDARLAFNRQTLTTVEAVGMTIPGDAKGSLEGLLARAA